MNTNQKPTVNGDEVKQNDTIIGGYKLNNKTGQLSMPLPLPAIEVKQDDAVDNTNKEKKEDSSPEAINHLLTLLKKVDKIQSELDSLKRVVKGITLFEENNAEIITDAAAVFKKEQELESNDLNYKDKQNIKRILAILSSKTKKQSVSINKNIEEQVIELLAKYLGYKPAGSDAINLGLMLAILKNQS